MNWFLSVVFLIFIFFCYEIIGRSVLLLSNNQVNSSIKTKLCGFIIVFFVGFIIGFPCQCLHLSWFVFRNLYFIAFIGIVCFSFFHEREYIKDIIFNFKQLIKKHFKDSWFIYVLIFFFLLFASTNVLVYYQNNYDDAYYIGKIVNQIGANQLSMENFYSGSLTNGEIGIVRLLNTYEITYGFFSSIFHISVPFFCRITMAIHNYFLIFSVYKLVAEFFVKKHLAQFCLIPFCLLLISAGYAMEGNTPISINMFDGWQFQSAIWYGGSIVRVLAIPTIFIFCEKLLYKFDFKNLLLLGIIYITFMSFSTIFLPYAIILTIVLFFGKGLLILNHEDSFNKKKRRIGFIYLILPVLVLFGSKLLDKISIFATDNYFSNVSSYIDFSNWYFYGDTLVYYGLAIFILAYFLFKKDICQLISICLTTIFLIIFSKLFYELIIISSGIYWFVALRFTTSIQLMLMLIIGCLIIHIIDKITSKRIILSAISILLTFGVIGYIYTHINEIKQQNWLASGMTEYGYSTYPLIKNDEMMPNIMCEVGAYFNNKEYGNYPLLVPESMNWDGYPMYTNGFVFASNRIELCTNNGANNLSKDQLDLLYKYYSNECNYSDIAKILSDHNINYILVQDKNQMDDLIRNGWTLEISSDKINETYYLLKK